MSRAETVGLNEEQELSAYSKAKRQQIIDGALKVFLKYGYEGTSMNRVAEEASVIKQTIYSHFDDKQGLFKAIIESLTLQKFKEQFGAEEIDVAADPEFVLRKIAGVFAGRKKDASYIALMRTVIGESARFPELARLYTTTVIKRGIQILTTYLEAHPELGIKDAEATARVYCGSLVNTILLEEVLYGSEIVPFDMQRIVDALVAMVLKKKL